MIGFLHGILGSMLFLSWLPLHGDVLTWQPEIEALHAFSNALTNMLYYALPLALAWLLRRRMGLKQGGAFFAFAGLILFASTTHWYTLLTLWLPGYVSEALTRTGLALLSLACVIFLMPLIARVLVIQTPADLRRDNEALTRQMIEAEIETRLLQDSERRYRQIYNLTPVPVQTLSMDGRITGVSDYWCDLMGTTREEAVGRKFADFLAPHEHDKVDGAFKLLLAGQDLRDDEWQFRRRSGEIIDVLVCARVQHLEDGSETHVLGVLTDVTKRNHTEALLRASEERLMQTHKMDALGKLTGGIAHDFNNMLTVVDGNLEMLRKRTNGDNRSQALVDAASRASLRAAKLTAQLLAFSRKQYLNPEPLDVVAVVSSLDLTLRRTAGETAVLQIDMPAEEAWPCMADRNQLETGLVNLVTNAAQAIQVEGVVRISVQNVALSGLPGDWPDNATDETPPAGDYVRIQVNDDGCGMSDDVRRSAPEPFFTTRGVGKGTGLGLSQTYGFVKQSGGAMLIESTPGKGTMVELFLPRASLGKSMVVTPAETLAPRENTHTRETLLVVEDEPEVLTITTESLRDLGYTVICACDGREALAALQANPSISLIFTDIVMPGMNGTALSREARKLRPDIAVMFASGYSEESLIAHVMPGAPFLQKPYRMGAVAKLIRACLDFKTPA